MFDIISIGAANIDIFVRSSQFVVEPEKKFATGIAIKLPHSSKNEISESLIASGGGATNTSVSFSRLGLKSACVARCGNDFFYPVIAKELSTNQVVGMVSLPPGDSTDFSVVLVSQDGGRSILVNRGVTRLTSQDIPWDQIKSTKWFYITSLEGNLDLLEQLIGFAKEYNIKIALNPGSRELSSPNVLIPLIKHVDFLLLNTEESQSLLRKQFNKDQFLDELIGLGAPIVSVTNGRDGAYVATAADKYYSPIINVSPVDETGAGDSFGSAFVASLVYGHHPQEALKWGITNSASVVSCLGAKPGLLTLTKIK